MNAVANRYAQVLLDVASEEKKSLSQLSDQFNEFVNNMNASGSETVSAIGSPSISSEEKTNALDALGKRFGLDGVLINLLKILATKGRFNEIGNIAFEFKRLSLKAEGKLLGELVTADALSQDEVAAITKSTSTKLGQPVVFTQTVDSSLLGGFVAKAGGITFDGSIRGQLERLRTKLLSESN